MTPAISDRALAGPLLQESHVAIREEPQLWILINPP